MPVNLANMSREYKHATKNKKREKPQEIMYPWFNESKEDRKPNKKKATEFYATPAEILMDLTVHGAKEDLKIKFVERTNKFIAAYQKSKRQH